MVHFAATNGNVNKMTNQSTERNGDGTTNNSKRNFPVTPHPASKKKRSDNSQSDNLSSLVSNTSSPQMDSVSIKIRCNDKMKHILSSKLFLNFELLVVSCCRNFYSPTRWTLTAMPMVQKSDMITNDTTTVSGTPSNKSLNLLITPRT